MKRLLLLFGLIYYCTSLSSQISLDSADLEGFMDGQIEASMQEFHINGVTISVVKDQDIFWSKGYGWANEKEGIKVDPAETLFRMGSISKTFVWTAVMQLYEAGKLDLDADIRTYIEDFEIDDSYEEPISMKHLMSHSAGFEDYYIQLFSTDTLDPVSLAQELKKHNPGRVRPPGVHSSYSNHGTGMAAYIVEKISGLSWNEYIQEHIFGPLGMKKTSFRFDLPDDLKNAHSQGYSYSDGVYKSGKFKNIPLAPVGLAATTAEDMLPFMAAHMNHGRYGEVQLLDSATSVQMQSSLNQHADGLRGMLYGFFDHSKNGYKIFGHGGATEFFFSYMLLMPDEEVGIFISTNTQGGVSLIRKVSNAFFDRYFPNQLQPETYEMSEAELEAFAGSYLSNRRPQKRFTKLIALLNTPMEVRAQDGKLILGGENPRQLIPISAESFQDKRSTDRVAFEKDDTGDYKYLYIDSSPHVAWEKIPLIESRGLNIFVLTMSLGLGIFACFYWLISFWFKKRYSIDRSGELPAISKYVLAINVLLLIAFAFSYGATLDSSLQEGIKGKDYFTFILSGAFAFLAILQMVFAIGHFSKKARFRSKLFYLILSTGMFSLGISDELLEFAWISFLIFLLRHKFLKEL